MTPDDKHHVCMYGRFTKALVISKRDLDDLDEEENPANVAKRPIVTTLCVFTVPDDFPPRFKRDGGLVNPAIDCANCKAFREIEPVEIWSGK